MKIAVPLRRRAQLAQEEIPAHYQLAHHLDQPVDWSAEFNQDLRTLVEAIAARSTR